VKLLDVVVTVVESCSEMGGSSACFTSADLAIVDDYYSTARAGELVSRGHSGDPGPDNAHIGAHVLGDAGEFWGIGVHPDRCRVTGVASHCGNYSEVIAE
jgi:hypothetical protein